MLKPLREVIAHTYTSVISIYGDLLAHMYVESSARVFKKYRSHNVSHTAQVYNVLYTYCGGCAGFQSKDSLHSLYSLYIFCIDYIDYIYIYIYIYIYMDIYIYIYI